MSKKILTGVYVVSSILVIDNENGERQVKSNIPEDDREVPEGWKLVPTELTAEMVEASGCEGRFKVSPHEQAQEMWETMLAAAPTVQGEPVGWYTEDHLDDKSATTYKAEVAQRWRDKGWPVWPLYTAPQPVPDVTPLVEALEQCTTSMLDSGYRSDAVVIQAARAALAAYRKQGDGK